MLVLVNYQDFKTKLPTFESFFAADKWIYLGITMAAVKVLHEFGHGLSCKKFGGECHEMGIMFLVFTPCLIATFPTRGCCRTNGSVYFIGAAGIVRGIVFGIHRHLSLVV